MEIWVVRFHETTKAVWRYSSFCHWQKGPKFSHSEFHKSPESYVDSLEMVVLRSPG